MLDDSHKRKSLGRGLGALLGGDMDFMTSENAVNAAGEKNVSLADLSPSPYQPRLDFDREALEALSQSVREKGVLQPLLVRERENGKYTCDRMTEEEMSKLWLAAKEFEHTIAEGNLVKLAEADVAFHEIIYRASDNKRLIQVLNNMREQIYRYRVEYLKEGETRDVLVKEHEELTRAIRERNVERAKELSFQHIENQRMAIMRSIEAENAEKEKREREKSRNHK